MTAKNHVVLALVPPAVFCGASAVECVPFFLGAGIGALVPDIDEPGSYIGRRLYFVSEVLRGLGLEHRTLTHSLLLPIMIAAMVYIGFGLDRSAEWLYGLAFGIFMHDVGDMLTKGGIKGALKPLYGGTVRLLPKSLAFYTGSFGEYATVVALTGAAALFLYLHPGGLISIF